MLNEQINWIYFTLVRKNCEPCEHDDLLENKFRTSNSFFFKLKIK